MSQEEQEMLLQEKIKKLTQIKELAAAQGDFILFSLIAQDIRDLEKKEDNLFEKQKPKFYENYKM